MAAARDQTLEHLRQKIREEMNAMADYVAADGACENFEEYKYATGKINGLGMAERFLYDVDEMLHRGDDD